MYAYTDVYNICILRAIHRQCVGLISLVQLYTELSVDIHHTVWRGLGFKCWVSAQIIAMVEVGAACPYAIAEVHA